MVKAKGETPRRSQHRNIYVNQSIWEEDNKLLGMKSDSKENA